MASVPDTANLPWWIGPRPAPWQAMLAGVQAGSAIRSNQLRTQQMMMEEAQSVRREETATRLKLMDLGMEGFRNELAAESFKVKQEADMLRVQGVSGLGGLVSKHIREGRLTDPEAQAEFHEFAAKYGAIIPEQTYNGIWDNNYKAAMDRDARAKGGQDATITERDFNNWKLLKKAAQEAPDDETRKDAELELSIFERMKNIGEVASGPPRINVDFGITKVGEAEQIWSRNAKTGAVTFKNMPSIGITATDQQKIEYASRVKALQDAFDDRQLKAPDGTRADFNEFQRQLDRLNEEFRTKASSAPAAPAAADPLGLFR